MKRKVGLFLMFGAAIPLVVASAAWACGVLATLSVNSAVVSPGQAITATGKNYSSSATASPVSIRLNTRSGKVLATTVPSATGRISETFSIPTGTSPGWYVLTATQFNADGTPKSGTPGRTSVRVQGSGSAANSSTAAAPWVSSKPTGPAGPAVAHAGSGSQSLLPLLLALGLSLTLLAAGSTLAGRRSRSLSGSQLGL